jgi:DNA polymerase I
MCAKKAPAKKGQSRNNQHSLDAFAPAPEKKEAVAQAKPAPARAKPAAKKFKPAAHPAAEPVTAVPTPAVSKAGKKAIVPPASTPAPKPPKPARSAKTASPAPSTKPAPASKPAPKPKSKQRIPIEEICGTCEFIIDEQPNRNPVAIAVNIAPETFTHFMLINVEYDRDSNKALMRFYDPATQLIYHMTDPTGHEPYCISRMSKETIEKNPTVLNNLLAVDGFKRIENVEKMDLLDFQVKIFAKLVGTTPLTIASGASCIKNVLPDVLEANIRYHLNYIADLQLVPGLYYSFDGALTLDDITPSADVQQELDDLVAQEKPEFQKLFKDYFQYFVPEIPDFPRVALDLEMFQEYENQFPDPETAKLAIIAASIVSTDGINEVLLLKTHPFHAVGDVPESLPPEFKIRLMQDEEQLIREVFRYLWKYPFVITFNGDNFDLRYLYNRARGKKMPDEEIPIKMERGVGLSQHSAFLKYGLHVDLYQFFRNRSIQGYALGGAYSEFSLDAVSEGLLGEQKHEIEGIIAQLPFWTLVYYNWKDGFLTLELTRFKDNTTMQLIVLLMRICRLPMNEIIRTWVSAWVKNLLIWEHRRRNCVVPNQNEVAKGVPTEAGLKGAFVLDPVPGVYFDVVVMDFSSLYPSIIKEYNLSYETLDPEGECETAPVPDTHYRVCTDRVGIMALVTGTIRDLRILYFKPRAKKVPFYNTLQAALKVLINASYGVYGAETFNLYCFAVADSTTAIGRYSIQNTINKAKDLGVSVLYGDTDSVFMKNPGEDIIKSLQEYADEALKIDLDVDKSYRFLALSHRKKNYLGVFKNGEIDIKGLVGKKSNTPQFIQDSFYDFTEIIKNIATQEDFNAKKGEIANFVKKIWNQIKKGTMPLSAYEIKVTLQGKMVRQIMQKEEPNLKIQHLMAARELYKLKQVPFEAGAVFSYVKTKTGAKAIQLADPAEIDRTKYLELFRSTFEQVLDPLGLNFEELIGVKKLDSFF